MDFGLFGDEMRSRAFFDHNYFFIAQYFLHLAGKLIAATRNRDDKFFVVFKTAEESFVRSGYFAPALILRQRYPPKLH
jgi:hypothetical protein